MNISEEVNKIYEMIFRRRIDKNKNNSQWTMINIRELKSKTEEKILELLQQGYTVKGGYYTTAVRGFHEYYLMYR